MTWSLSKHFLLKVSKLNKCYRRGRGNGNVNRDRERDRDRAGRGHYDDIYDDYYRDYYQRYEDAYPGPGPTPEIDGRTSRSYASNYTEPLDPLDPNRPNDVEIVVPNKMQRSAFLACSV